MSEKITKEFTFEAPEKMYDLSSGKTRTISSTYRGASEIWIYVDLDTGLNPQFVSEGDLQDPTTTWRHRSILLSAENPNHILLMDLLKNSTGHETEELVENLTSPGDVPLNPNLVFSYRYPKHPSASEVFDLSKTRIDENKVIHYEWSGPKGMTKEEFLETIRVHKLRTEETLRDPLVISNPNAKNMYTKFLAVLDYIKDDLLERVEPWKIPIPLIHTL